MKNNTSLYDLLYLIICCMWETPIACINKCVHCNSCMDTAQVVRLSCNCTCLSAWYAGMLIV